MLAARVGSAKFTALFSSPYPRCLETLEPLRRCAGIEVKPDERLSEATTLVALESFLMGLDNDGVYVVCSHGNVVPALVELLVGRQVSTLPEPILSSKGSIWDIEIERGTVGSVRFIEPDRNREYCYHSASVG
jgi:8-oxo-dGTP diphosphatase